MTLFEYLGVLLSVVMGLGLTHVLIGFSKLIHHRGEVRVYWVHVLWAVNVIVFIVAIWWGMFWWSRLENWTFFEFLFVLLYSTILFLLASVLYPWDVPERYDFEEHFYRHRPWFFGILTVAWCVDVAETAFKARDGLRDLPPPLSGVGGDPDCLEPGCGSNRQSEVRLGLRGILAPLGACVPVADHARTDRRVSAGVAAECALARPVVAVAVNLGESGRMREVR